MSVYNIHYNLFIDVFKEYFCFYFNNLSNTLLNIQIICYNIFYLNFKEFKVINIGGKTMRIVIFTEVLAPYVCGISSYIDVLKSGLEDLSHKVLIVTSSLHIKKPVFKDGILRCPAKKSANKFGYECKKTDDQKVLNIISSFKPDVFHIHTDTKIGYMGLLIADKLNRPIIFTIHDYFIDRFAYKNSKWVWRIKTFFEKKHFTDMLDNSTIITSSCKRAVKFIRKADRKRRITVIPPNINKVRFDYRRTPKITIDKIRKKYNLSKNSTVAVFAGNLSVEKNIEFILNAFAKYIDRSDKIQFLIVGNGTETEHLKAVCKKFDIIDRVKFTGEVAYNMMPEIYSACDVYVSSAEDSLTSMSFLEAIACGLPVLIKETDKDYISDMIIPGKNGFSYHTDKELANILKIFSSSTPVQQKALKSLVRKTIKNTPNYTLARNTIKVYEKAIKIHKMKYFKNK